MPQTSTWRSSSRRSQQSRYVLVLLLQLALRSCKIRGCRSLRALSCTEALTQAVHCELQYLGHRVLVCIPSVLLLLQGQLSQIKKNQEKLLIAHEKSKTITRSAEMKEIRERMQVHGLALAQVWQTALLQHAIAEIGCKHIQVCVCSGHMSTGVVDYA